jgi:hypothetical protein
MAISTATAAQMRPTATPALQPDRWPQWAKELARSRQPQDRGIGDTVVHEIGDTASAAFQEWFKKTFDQSCGCADRQAWLNRHFPYL